MYSCTAPGAGIASRPICVAPRIGCSHPDLRSLGVDCTPTADITLATWTGQIGTLVAAQADPVVLVGHSRGGIVISEVVELVPDRVGLLVYLTAFLLESGCSLQEAGTQDPDSLVGS